MMDMENKLKGADLKSLALMPDSKGVEWEQKIMTADNELIRKTKNEVILERITKTPKGFKLVDRKLATKQEQLGVLAVKLTLEISLWFRQEVSEGKLFEMKVWESAV